MTLRIGSVCTGYGGLDEAVQQVFGGELAWVSDIDPGACKIIDHRMPDVRNVGDLRFVHWRRIQPVHIYIGGYPCQPFSNAGQRKGTADARHIWPYIAHSLRVLRPRIAIFENVAGHLRLGFDTVLADLASLGFDVEWCLVRADEVGAPHQRKRLFILATAANTPREGQQGPDTLGRRAAGDRSVASDTSDFGHERGWDARRRGHGPTDRRHALADADRRGLPGHSELQAGRDALRQRERDDAHGRHPSAAADTPRNGRREGRPEPAWIEGGLGAASSGAPAWGKYAAAVHRWERVTGQRAPRPTDDRTRLSPAAVEWMMGLPAGHVTAVPGLSRTQQLKALGNGVVPQQAAAAIRLLANRASA